MKAITTESTNLAEIFIACLRVFPALGSWLFGPSVGVCDVMHVCAWHYWLLFLSALWRCDTLSYPVRRVVVKAFGGDTYKVANEGIHPGSNTVDLGLGSAEFPGHEMKCSCMFPTRHAIPCRYVLAVMKGKPFSCMFFRPGLVSVAAATGASC